MTVTVVPTVEDHRRVLRTTLRRLVRTERVVGSVFVLAALPALLSAGPGRLSGLFFLAVGAGLVISSFTLPAQLSRRIPAESMRPRTLHIGPEGIRVRTEMTFAEVAWPAVRAVTRTPHLWVLRRDRMTPPLALMRRHLTAEQAREFEGYLAEHGLGADGGGAPATASGPASSGGAGPAAATRVRPPAPDDEHGGSSRL